MPPVYAQQNDAIRRQNAQRQAANQGPPSPASPPPASPPHPLTTTSDHLQDAGTQWSQTVGPGSTTLTVPSIVTGPDITPLSGPITDTFSNLIDKSAEIGRTIVDGLTTGANVVGSVNDNLGSDDVRGLNQHERDLATEVFGDSINLDAVNINESSALAGVNEFIPGNSSSRPFVLGNTINSNKPLSDEELIHELGHIWQFQTQGPGYLAGALDEDYDVSFAELEAHQNDPIGTRLDTFGVEEQAEIPAEYFELTQQGPLNAEDQHKLAVYQNYIDEFQAAKPIEGAEHEIYEGVDEVTGEILETFDEVGGELLDGKPLNATVEVLEGAAEVTWEFNEAVAETTYEVGKDGVEFIADNASDLWSWRPSWP